MPSFLAYRHGLMSHLGSTFSKNDGPGPCPGPYLDIPARHVDHYGPRGLKEPKGLSVQGPRGPNEPKGLSVHWPRGPKGSKGLSV